MNTQEALKFAKERLSRIGYLLETASGLPCRSFHEKQEEMLSCSVSALEDQAEREKGCLYCNHEMKFKINFDGQQAGIAYLHKCTDGWGLFLQIGGGPVYYIDVGVCPKCGRDLRKPVEK